MQSLVPMLEYSGFAAKSWKKACQPWKETWSKRWMALSQRW
jgi:hypothetical protein